MTLFNATADQITDIEVIEPSNGKSMLIEFISQGRVYDLEITQDMVDYTFGCADGIHESAWGNLTSYTDSMVDLSEITEEEIIEVAQSFKSEWYDVTEDCPEKVAIIRKQARKSLLSYVVSSANKLRSALKSMSLAMHTAWTKARILATGVVQFVKMQDVDIEGEIPVQTRRVASLESFGVERKTANKTAGLLRFIDLDKIAKGLSAAESVISFHVWQVVGWSVNKSIG